MSTGTTPSASGTSSLAHATVAIRSGLDSTVVWPKACSTVTGKASSAGAVAAGVVSSEADESSSESPQAARVSGAASAAVAARRRRRLRDRLQVRVGKPTLTYSAGNASPRASLGGHGTGCTLEAVRGPRCRRGRGGGRLGSVLVGGREPVRAAGPDTVTTGQVALDIAPRLAINAERTWNLTSRLTSYDAFAAASGS